MFDILKCCRNYKHIYCYGAGKYGKYLRIYLYCHDVDIDGFITTQKSKCDTVLKKKVYALDEITYSNDTLILLGVSVKYQDEIINELHKKNFGNYIVIDASQMATIINDIKIDDKWADLTDNHICVLLYHRVNNYKNDYWRLAITPEMFEQHIDAINNKYSIIRFGDNYDNVNSFSVVITFDDGYADNFEYALPILEKCQVPASIFVSSGNINTDKEFWWDKLTSLFLNDLKLPSVIEHEGQIYEIASQEQRMEFVKKLHAYVKGLSPDERNDYFNRIIAKYKLKYVPNTENRTMSLSELREIGKSKYIDIGAHTITHTALSAEEKDIQLKEIQESKKYLEETLGKKIDIFSYPFGTEDDFTSETVEIVHSLGFKKAVTTDKGIVKKNQDLMRIPRYRVPFCCDSEKLLQEIKSIFLANV